MTENNNSDKPQVQQEQKELKITPMLLSNLTTATKWTKFLAIIKFIGAGLLILIGSSAGGILSKIMMLNEAYAPYSLFGDTFSGVAIVYSVIMFLLAAVYFFNGYFLIMFANKTKKAIAGNDSELLEEGMRHMKNYWIYTGILTIVGIAISLFPIAVFLLTVSIIL